MIKKEVIQVRFSEQNVVSIRAKTRMVGMTISGWIRMVVLEKLAIKGQEMVVESIEEVNDITSKKEKALLKRWGQ